MKEKIPKFQVLNWEFFVPADFEYKTFRIIKIWRRNFFQKLSFWFQFLLRNQVSLKNSHLKKKRFDSICSGKNNIVFTFRAYFKRHDFEVNLFFENRKFEMEFFERNVGFCSEVFSYNLISFKIESFLSWRISIKIFSKNYFVETNIFLKIRFSVQFISRNQISIKTSGLRNNVLTRFAPRPTTSFSLCMLILKGMTL